MTQYNRIATELQMSIINGFEDATNLCYTISKNAGWYTDIETGEPIQRNEPEMIALMHSELSECLEAVRKGLMDDKLTHRQGAEVELADCIIRILDYAGYKQYDIGKALIEKCMYNMNRADHKIENRKKEGGKAF